MFTKMAGKRSASTELNHDNWDEEDQPEEAGTFKKASDDIMEKRVVKRAKRRLQTSEDSTKSAFSAFTGFKTTSTSSAHTSSFSFLANTNTNTTTNVIEPSTKLGLSTSKSSMNSESLKSNENGTNKKENSGTEKSATSGQSPEYFAKLKGLNESVAQWIKSHVDATPFCILTPIFKDYEKYLKEIEAKYGTETEKPASDQTQSVQNNDKKESTNVEKRPESSPFGGTNTKSPLSSTEWKPEKSIFGNINTGSTSLFRKSDSTTDTNKSIFSSTEQWSESPKSVFGNIDPKAVTKNIFGSVSSEKNPFLSKPFTASDNKIDEQETKSDSQTTTTTSITNSTFATTNTTTFCFGQSSTTSNTSTGFSFGSAKPYTFGAQMVKPQEPDDNEGKDDEDEEPPKVDFKPVTEEGAIYEQRCKVFVKKDGNFSDRGVGMLFLKPTPNDKTQLLVRAETALGNLLLNTLLTESIPTKRMNKNTIMLVCLPKPESTPPPVPVLLRVKTEEDANTLLETLDKHKK